MMQDISSAANMGKNMVMRSQDISKRERTLILRSWKKRPTVFSSSKCGGAMSGYATALLSTTGTTGAKCCDGSARPMSSFGSCTR